MAKPQAPTRDDFAAFETISTRWMDNDIYGHVNNVTYFSYFDTAVNGWYMANGLLDLKDSKQVFLVVENSCSYFQEITFPQTVHAGLKLKRIGKSSLRFEIGLFTDDSFHAAAKGEYVHVLVDRATRRPVEMSEDQRAVLEILL